MEGNGPDKVEAQTRKSEKEKRVQGWLPNEVRSSLEKRGGAGHL